MTSTPSTSSASITHFNRLAAFFGRGLRRTETRFCPRRKGDSCSTSKSTSRLSSSPSRACSSLGGYNSSCWMEGPLFRAIRSGQLSSVNRREQENYNFFSRNEIGEISSFFAQDGTERLLIRSRRPVLPPKLPAPQPARPEPPRFRCREPRRSFRESCVPAPLAVGPFQPVSVHAPSGGGPHPLSRTPPAFVHCSARPA